MRCDACQSSNEFYIEKTIVYNDFSITYDNKIRESTIEIDSSDIWDEEIYVRCCNCGEIYQLNDINLKWK